MKKNSVFILICSCIYLLTRGRPRNSGLKVGEMKVQCDVCEKAQATILCCADDAALCELCDAKVHAANKLAEKHQRIPLIYPSPDEELPRCDICQV